MFFCAWQGANCCRARYYLQFWIFSGIAISRTVKQTVVLFVLCLGV